MLVCLDVDYRADAAVAGCVGFHSWTADTVAFEVVRHTPAGEAYHPGEFYKRELPSLLDVLNALDRQPATVIIDGYVWLGAGQKGLGAHLYEQLNEAVAVVGVAKNPYRSARDVVEVNRGESGKPLWVTAAGLDLEAAAAGVQSMAGAYRIPSMLKRADRLCRDATD